MTSMAVESVGAGSVAGQFEEVFARYHRRIRSLFYSWLEDWATSDDLAAEVFATLWRDMSERGLTLDTIEYLHAFLAQRARWVRAAYYKALAARREQPWQAAQDEDSDRSRIEALAAALTTDGPEETAVSRVDLARVIAVLPDKQHRVVLLRYLLDMGPDEVAVITGWPPRTVKRLTADGLNALREAAGVPTGDKVHETTAVLYEAMRVAYQDSITAGKPLTRAQLARRFGRSWNVADIATAGIASPAKESVKENVRAGLRAGLAEGTYRPGSAMPTVREIATQYGSSPGNVAAVMRELLAEGLLVKLTGPGYGPHGRFHAAPATAAAA
jgi:RNA polymerase sigma factor (sigma-70 family)